MNAANAAAAAAATGGLHAPPLPASSYQDYYNDASNDEYNGNYGALMREFDAVTGRAPGELRKLACSSPTSSLGYLYLVQAPGNIQHPGYLMAIHSVSKYVTRLGFPQTQWDEMRFGTVGHIVAGQVPTVDSNIAYSLNFTFKPDR